MQLVILELSVVDEAGVESLCDAGDSGALAFVIFGGCVKVGVLDDVGAGSCGSLGGCLSPFFPCYFCPAFVV